MTENENEVLVVVSKLKQHVKTAHDLSTSGTVPTVLTAFLAKICTKAAQNAKSDGRKTLMDRDLDFLNQIVL